MQTMNDRPTPETNLEEMLQTQRYGVYMVKSDFARRLERERDDLLDRLTALEQSMPIELAKIERERDEAREWQTFLSGWGGTPEIVNDFIKGQQMRVYVAQNAERERDEAREELASERALADRLANALTACERWVNQPCDVKTEANKALIEWKEARK